MAYRIFGENRSKQQEDVGNDDVDGEDNRENLSLEKAEDGEGEVPNQ